jgi:3-oxoacyl-[acyl-carrier protein] reductase
MSLLEGRVALVTGASRGIGRGVGLALARAGATVIGTATTQAGADSFGDELARAGLRGGGLVLNVNDATAIDEGVAAVRSAHGEVSVLVNNAGITRDNLLIRMKQEEWDEIVSTNLTSVYRLSRAVIRGMMKMHYGRIINVTSVVGAAGNAGQTNYAAAKAGAAGFSKALAREVGGRNITVNCVAPGYIDTDMTRALGEAQRAKLLEQIPLGRLGEVDDVAQAVVFLASAGASYITGSTLHVNGGMYMD